MGWKTLKETYSIEHTVCVTSAGVCIGSTYVHDLAVIDPQSGRVRTNDVFRDFLTKNYPALAAAEPEEILALIQAEDSFDNSVPVYTYDGAVIVEKHCETLGWPNVTHDGDLMYENTYSPDRDIVIGWAKRNAQLSASHLEKAVARQRAELEGLESQMYKAHQNVHQLEQDHPSIPAAAY